MLEVSASSAPPSPVLNVIFISVTVSVSGGLSVTFGFEISEHGRTKYSDSTGVGSGAVAIVNLYLPGVIGAMIPVPFEVLKSIGLYPLRQASTSSGELT